MGVSTVIKDYGTDILNAIRENDLQALKAIVEKQLKSSSKISRLFVSDIKHRPTKKFACPLILAARQEDPRILRYMMEKGVDPNFVHHTIFSSKRHEIVTALHIAVDLGLYDNAETLLAANGDPNIGDHNQETPLHIAVKKSDRIMTRLLLSNGGNPAIPDRHGNAVLHIATMYGHLQLVRTMLKYDADVYQQGHLGAIPPHIAAKEGHIHLIQLFCSRDMGNINIKIPCYVDKREKAPLHLASENAHVETVRSLLTQFDADVNLRDSDGNTPLHCCVLNPYDAHRMRDKDDFNETARILVKHHVSINEKNVYGDTALHLAAMNHFQRIVELLLEVGANPFAENEEGLKPIDVVPDSDPVTKNVLKMAMLNPRPLKNISHSMDTLERERTDIHTSNMQHALMADGVVLSSSQGTPENALDQSLSIRSVSQSSFPSVFDEHAEQQGGLGRVPVGHKGHLLTQSQGNNSQQNRSNDDVSLSSKQEESTDPSFKRKRQKRRDGKRDDHEQREDEQKEKQKENEIPTYTAVKKHNKKHKDEGKYPQEKQVEDDTVSYVTQSSVADDASSVFSMGAANTNAVVQREIQKLFSKQHVVNKKKKHHGSVVSDSGSYMDESLNGSQNDTLERSLEQTSESYMAMDSVPRKKVSKSKNKAAKHKEDDKYLYENLPSVSESVVSESTAVSESVATESVTSEDSSRRKKKKAKSKSKLNEVLSSAKQSKQNVVPYKGGSGDMQPGSVKVNTVPGRPGTIEVQYSGGPITISVDTSAVDQNADGQYYFTDQHGHQFPVDLQNPKDLFYLQQLQQQQPSHPQIPPPLPPKGSEPIYANIQEALKGRRQVPQPPTEGEFSDISGFTNGSVVITEMDDTQESEEQYDQYEEEIVDDNEEEGEVTMAISAAAKEVTSTAPIPASRSTQQKKGKQKGGDEKAQTAKPRPMKRVSKSSVQEESKKEDSRSVQAQPLVVTRAVSVNEEEDWNASPDYSPNVSPQYKTFSQKLMWAKQSAGEASRKAKKKAMQFEKEDIGKPREENEDQLEHDEHTAPREEDEERQELIEEEQASSSSSATSTSSEDESVIAAPQKKVPVKEPKQGDHLKMYSITPEIEVDQSSSDTSSSSSDGESSVVHRPGAGVKKMEFKEARSEKKIETVHAKLIKNEEIVKVKVISETKEEKRTETYDTEPSRRLPRVKARTKSPLENLEPLPGENKKKINGEMPVVTAEERRKPGEWVHYDHDPEMGHLHQTLEVSTSLSHRSESIDSIASDYSEGGTRRLYMRVTGEVPKAFTKEQKDPARRAFMHATPQSIESSSDTSDVEFGSRNSLSERVGSPASIERAKRWADEGRPIQAKSPEGLVPRNSPALSGGRSPVSPVTNTEKSKSKTKLIGSYTKPYKSFGKIETKTDALEDAVVISPHSLSKSPSSFNSSFGSPPSHHLASFPPSEVKITPSSPEIEKAKIIKPHAITPQNSKENIVFPTLPQEKITSVSIEESTKMHGNKIRKSKASVGLSQSAFKKNIKVMEDGPEELESEHATQLQSLQEKQEETAKLNLSEPNLYQASSGVIKSSFKKNIKVVEPERTTYEPQQATQALPKKKKTVSLTEERTSKTGEVVKTVTTTVTTSTLKATEKAQSVILFNQDSSDTETSESEDDSSKSSSSESQEEYETEHGSIKKTRSESMDLLPSPRDDLSSVKSRKSSSSKKPRPKLSQTHFDQEPEQQSRQDVLSGKFHGTNQESKLDAEQKKKQEMLMQHEQMRKDAEQAHKQQVKPKVTAKKPNVPGNKPIVPVQKSHRQDPAMESKKNESSVHADKQSSVSSISKEKQQIKKSSTQVNEALKLLSSKTQPKKEIKETNIDDDVFTEETQTTQQDSSSSSSSSSSTSSSSTSSSSSEDEVMYEQYENEPGTRMHRSGLEIETVKEEIIETNLNEILTSNTAETRNSQTGMKSNIPSTKSSYGHYDEEPGSRNNRLGGKEAFVKQTNYQNTSKHGPQSMTEANMGKSLNQGNSVTAKEPVPLEMKPAGQNDKPKQRIQGRRQIGKPKRGEQVIAQDQKTKLVNTSFGPEDEEVAKINASAKSRKDAIRAKKLREYEWAMKQKLSYESEKISAEEEWEQALQAAKAQHGKSARVINPIPGVEITISGDLKEVKETQQDTSGNNSQPKPTHTTSQVIPRTLSLENIAAETKASFLKLSGKRKKKDKATASTEDLSKEVKKKTRKKKGKDERNVSSEVEKNVENVYESIDDVHGATEKPFDGESPQSPEDYGILRTVMGARVERDDTVKQAPESVRKGGLFNLPVKRNRRSIEDDNFSEEGAEVVPNQSGLSQNEILAGMMKNKRQPTTPTSRQAAMDNIMTETSQVTELSQSKQPEQLHVHPSYSVGIQGKEVTDPSVQVDQYTSQTVSGQTFTGQVINQQYSGQQVPSLNPVQQYSNYPATHYPGQNTHPNNNQPHFVAGKNKNSHHGQRPQPKETCIDDDLDIQQTVEVRTLETDIDADLLPGMESQNPSGKDMPVHETNLDDDLNVAQFSRTQAGRKSKGRKKRVPPGQRTSSSSSLPEHPAPIPNSSSLPPNPQELSQMWSSQQQQEDDMRKVLENMDNIYEQPVCHEQHFHPPPQDQQKPPLPKSRPPTGRPPPRPEQDNNARALPNPPMWSQQQGKAEVVEMQPQVRKRRPMQGQARSTSSLGAMSDSEALHRPRRGKRGRRYDGHHSDAEMNDFVAPKLPKDPQVSLQEAALKSITSGLKNQPKLTPLRPQVSEAERQINYTRGVYRPKPMEWHGSANRSTASLGSGRYDDSSLISQMWLEKHRPATTESEGEADTEEQSYYDDSPERRSQGHYGHPPAEFMGQPQLVQHHPSQMAYPPPHSIPSASDNYPPVKRRVKKKRQIITEPGPVDFSKYGPTARLWMENVDKKTVTKSDTMFLHMMPKDHLPSPDIQKAFRTSEISMGDDDVFLSSQWVIARGRNMRRKKRQLDQQKLSGASSGSDLEGMGDQSLGGRQILLFFRLSSNWKDLAWVLFDSIHDDNETIRMLKDIEIKHPHDLCNQVNELMHRWWKKKGHEATIEELQQALDLCHMPYLMEDCNDVPNFAAAASGSEDLDVTAVSENDPDVSRLMHEYKVRSLNNSFRHDGSVSDSEHRQSYNLSADNLLRRLNEKGVTINRSNLGSLSSSFTRSQKGSQYDGINDESVDYYSDGESRRSFIIVQPQLKGGDYRHETNI